MADRYGEENAVVIEAADANVNGYLHIPEGAQGIVVFAHGSGSGRHSPRNQSVASMFQKGGLATLLIDLLTPEEEAIDMETRHLRFDIPFLAKRLNSITDWLLVDERTKGLTVGYIGSSTGAAAALVAAADNREDIAAVVSRGGRPDLAEGAFSQLQAPTLLIVGGNDFQVLELNEQVYAQLDVEKQLEVVPGATHLFEEPGTLEQASALARDWFLKWLLKR